MEKKLTVIKVGTSTLTYENGKINYRRIESLCKVIADLQNSGEQIILVSSGAIGVGMGKAGLSVRPTETKKKQALAAIGCADTFNTLCRRNRAEKAECNQYS